MKIILAITIFTLLLLTFACNQTETNQNSGRNMNSMNVNSTNSTIEAKSAKFKAEFKTNPTEVKAGEQTEFSFTVKNEKGEIVKDLPLAHEKPMHLLVVSDDLAEFYHIHPELQADGAYKIPFKFTNGGNFKLYADYTPKDSTQIVENYSLKVSGNERAKVELKVDEKSEKTVDGIKVMMKPDAELIAGKELMLNFTVFDEKTNKPITDLEKYLGEYAHFVIISQDLKQFVHAHPMSKMGDTKEKVDESKPHSHDDKVEMKDMKMANPSEVSAHTSFPQSGLFKVFAQFQRGGKIITVPFVVNVKEGDKKTVQAVENVNFPSDAKKVIVSKNGYEPSEVSFKKGEPMKISFYRTDAENCGDEVVFKDLNITKKLPVGEVVTIELKDLKSNEISFACGMNMLKGKVLSR